ncbi:MAG: hypothetical protein ABSE16_00020 [Verrucomicrobiota bacterium]
MKRPVQIVAFLALCLLVTGCLTPVKNQMPLACVSDWARPAGTNDTKLVIFNTSDYLAYGLDGSGRINVRLDGRGVGQINLRRYAQLIIPKGAYDVELVHLDMGTFTSHHQIELTEPESYLQIFATPTSNRAFLVSHLPPDFAGKFRPIPQP